MPEQLFDDFEIEHRDGVPWHDAPLPRRFHRCRPQTTGFAGRLVERCACGAMRIGSCGPWLDKNQTRKHRRKLRRR